ncbi:peptidyl-tRNA hydrolase [Candidatus Micrarchaeota archaeon]|nr:peptidyl-tRNA hydrolase [Candidatus Micrarchaeota archaeon]
MLGLKNILGIKKSEIKQAIIVRNDLKMGKGKIAAQASHASLASFLKTQNSNPEITEKWLEEGMKKIVLKVDSEKDLLIYFQHCKDSGIPCELIRDAGLTQIKGGSITCFGAGPYYEDDLNKILGRLKLL